MNTTGLKLSPKYGLNPTVSVCFWCGEEKNEVALLGRIGDGRRGEDIEASMYTVLDYEPCECCKAKMSAGVTVVEATTVPNSSTSVPIQDGVYPTGRFVVLRPEAAARIFRGSITPEMQKCFLEADVFHKIFMERAAPT